MSSGNLFILAITGLLLFIYEILKRSPELVSAEILRFLLVAVLVCGSIAAVNFLVTLIIDIWFGQVQGKQVSALLKLIVSLILYFCFTFIIFRIIGLDITALFTTSALLTAIIGLALQSTLGNFFSGISLRIDQPFQIGDRIVFKEQAGQVVSITWRATTIRTSDRILIHIPNGLLAQESVKVIPAGGQARRAVDFVVPAAAPPQRVIQATYNALLNQPHPNINLDQPLLVRLLKLESGDTSLYTSYRILYFPLQYGESNILTDREILCRVWYALRRQQFFPDYNPPDDRQYVPLIHSIGFLRHFPSHAKKRLLELADCLLFDAGESLDDNNLPAQCLFIVVTGQLVVDQKLIQNTHEPIFQSFSRNPKLQSLGGFSQDTLDEIANHLAQSIGPAAFTLVQDTAHQVSSIYWLYQRLSGFIAEPEERQKFLKHSPQAPAEILQRGDFFGELSLCLDRPIPFVRITTVVETELLAIPQAALSEVLAHNPVMLGELIQRLTDHINQNLLGTIRMPVADALGIEEVAQQIRRVFPGVETNNIQEQN